MAFFVLIELMLSYRRGRFDIIPVKLHGHLVRLETDPEHELIQDRYEQQRDHRGKQQAKNNPDGHGLYRSYVRYPVSQK
jgi:hypothetical protein